MKEVKTLIPVSIHLLNSNALFFSCQNSIEETPKVRKYCFSCDHAVPAFHGKKKFTKSTPKEIPSTWLELYLKQLENNISACQPYAPWRNIKKFRQLRFVKSSWHREKHCCQWWENYFNDTAQFREDLMEIYI